MSGRPSSELVDGVPDNLYYFDDTTMRFENDVHFVPVAARPARDQAHRRLVVRRTQERDDET